MKINQNLYPYNIDVKKLPFYLTGIGGSEFQYHITRMDGYHWHQILFSAHGSGILKFDNITMTVAEGDYFFLPAGYPHEYYTEAPPWDVRWIAFDGYACAHVLGQFHMTKPIIITPQDSTALQNMYNKMFTSQKSDRIYCDYTCSGLVYDYVLEFYRIMDHKSNKGRSDRNRILLPVLDYIDEHFRSDFPLTILAEQAGISSQHLCRVFKETMNMRPNEYLTQRRLQEAKRLLQQNKLPISEIAIHSGFPNAGYFSTVFKRYEGLTPQEYKLHIGIKGSVAK